MNHFKDYAHELINMWKSGQTQQVILQLESLAPLENSLVSMFISQESPETYQSFTIGISSIIHARKLLNHDMISSLPKAEITLKSIPTASIKKTVPLMNLSSNDTESAHVTKNSVAPLHCTKCAFHSVIEDPDLEDSFNRDDCAIVCTKAKNLEQNKRSNWVAERQEFAIISGSLRPYEIEKCDARPTWCPLLK